MECLLHHATEGVLITDQRGTILRVNPAFTEITGYSREEAIGRKPNLLRSRRQPPAFYRQMWEALNTRGFWQGEIWNRRRNGQAYLQWLTINRIDDAFGHPSVYVGLFQDLTELRSRDEHIRRLAFHDALTGLPNRQLLLERLSLALERARRDNQMLAVIFVDLDRFKGINEALGHEVGDRLLCRTGQRLRDHLRSSDTLSRVGGDEFLILMENLGSPQHCASRTQQLLQKIALPIRLSGYELGITASMGMAFFPEDGDSPSELMKRAEMAMYAAKGSGGNGYRFFREEMLERTANRLKMEIELRQAISKGELELHYQPKVDLGNGRLTGVEALVRWQRPDGELCSPAEFIPLAEESRLICDIGDWVLCAACQQAALWYAQGESIRVSVNISARQLEDAGLLDQVRNLLRQFELPPHLLELELTESLVMADPQSVSGLLQALRALGVGVAVDDFGTGYSSLAYLRRLPLDTLKIDRSFVQDALNNEEDAQIIKTILALGLSLKMEVIAEGVENEDQARLLHQLGCTQAQGYLYGRPMTAEQFNHWLSAREHAD